MKEFKRSCLYQGGKFINESVRRDISEAFKKMEANNDNTARNARAFI